VLAVVVTYLGFPLLLALLVGVHVLVREVSRRALGEGEATRPSWRPMLATAAGLVASYLTCAVFFFVAILGFGRQENTLRVRVMQPGPASEAGLRDGDRVVAVNGTHPASWDELRAMVHDDGDRLINMEVERGAEILHLDVQPRDGRIGVASILERHEIPLGLAATGAMALPGLSIARQARELTRGLTAPTARNTLMGPVAIIVREFSLWPLIGRLGELAAYAWPFSIVIAFVVSRARATSTATRGR